MNDFSLTRNKQLESASTIYSKKWYQVNMRYLNFNHSDKRFKIDTFYCITNI